MSTETGFGWWVRFGLWVAIALWAAIAVAMAAAIVVDASAGAKLAPSKDLIAPLVAATGVLIAVLAFLRDRGKIERERSEARSKIFLEQAKQSLEQAFDLLKGLTQDRVKWIRAARLISEAEALGASITSDDYRRVYALAAAQIRHLFYEALMVTNEKGEQVALPAAFFFGLADWRTNREMINDQAIDAAPQTTVRGVTPGVPVPEVGGLGVAAESIIVVYEFIRFPEGYDDPLDKIDIDTWSSWPSKHGVAQGAYRYLQHRSQYILIGNQMLDRETKERVPRSP